jgi:hypothetical protein
MAPRRIEAGVLSFLDRILQKFNVEKHIFFAKTGVFVV